MMTDNNSTNHPFERPRQGVKPGFWFDYETGEIVPALELQEIRRKRRHDKIKIKLIDSNVMTHWPCTVCGGETSKAPVLCEDAFPDPKIRVCEECLKNGDIDNRLRQHAADLTEHIHHITKRVAFLNSLVGRLEVPTYEQWLRRVQGYEIRCNIACKAEQAKARQAATA